MLSGMITTLVAAEEATLSLQSALGIKRKLFCKTTLASVASASSALKPLSMETARLTPRSTLFLILKTGRQSRKAIEEFGETSSIKTGVRSLKKISRKRTKCLKESSSSVLRAGQTLKVRAT
jgi:hypothetical protein